MLTASVGFHDWLVGAAAIGALLLVALVALVLHRLDQLDAEDEGLRQARIRRFVSRKPSNDV